MTSRTSGRPARAHSSAPVCGAARTGRSRPTSEDGMVYIPSKRNHCNNLEGKVEQRVPRPVGTGSRSPDFHYTVDTKAGFYGETAGL